MWRVLKNKKRLSLKDKRGMTLTELIVVLGIIAVLLPLSFGGYSSTRKQKYIQHVANITQTSARDTFIDVLSTRVESTSGTCNTLSPQIIALRIKLGANSPTDTDSLNKVALCIDQSTGLLAASDIVEKVDLSGGINYKQDVKISFNNHPFDVPLPSNVTSGYLYLIFTSPFGKYYSFYSSSTNSDTANTAFKNRGWTPNADFIYEPSSTTNEGYMIIYFTDTANGNKYKLFVTEAGNVELANF